ncbi:MAG: 3-phosphoshikimate 1-carboxyvinyltransferase [Acidimicrobiales bacterium]|nr:MAG: 3-phosphoshikimate 1-carboxyvinyltransferase [Acidimicrobiales bacterium]
MATVDPRSLPDPYEIEPLTAQPDATIRLPGSKSITNRALVAAALAEGDTTLHGVLFADDTEAMLAALGQLGIELRIDRDAATVTVVGCGGELPGVETTIDVRQSGTTARFLTPAVALGAAPVVVDADPQMRDRPMDDQIDALRAMGVTVEELGDPGRLPLRLTGPIRAAGVGLAADVSSQFLSGLLLSGAIHGLDARLTTSAVSRPYLDMTATVMRSFGAEVSDDDGTAWTVRGGYTSPGDYEIEPDASAASYFLAAAAITGGRVRIEGLGRSSMQGDVAFADVLADMGATVDVGPEHIEVVGGPLRGVTVDLRHISDTAPTLAVVAAFAEGPTTITDIGFVKGKESDRIRAPVRELQRCGVDAEEIDGGLIIRPAGPPTAATFDTYDDHRMAMAFSLVGLVVPGVAVRDPGCVAKTFPGYFAALEQLR